MSNKVALAKLAVHLVGAAGVSKVVNDVITNNTSIETTADAVKVWAGAIVIGSMVAEQAQKHVDTRMSQAIAWFESRKTANETAV
jgi:hypothetical protein